MSAFVRATSASGRSGRNAGARSRFHLSRWAGSRRLAKTARCSLPDPAESLLQGADAARSLLEYYRDRARALQAQIAEDWRTGRVRTTAAARQTVIQIFHTRDGIHREADSVFARIGHETWKDISITLPPGAGATPLRVDFLSAFTTLDLESLRLTSGAADLFPQRSRRSSTRLLLEAMPSGCRIRAISASASPGRTRSFIFPRRQPRPLHRLRFRCGYVSQQTSRKIEREKTRQIHPGPAAFESRFSNEG